MNHQARMRWRCRRGMLELDIVLQRFIDNHYEQLDEHQLELFEMLLSLSDHDLWNIIIDNTKEPDNQFQPVLKLLQEN
ncbi:MAG TPA: succinate dehydrogenase assembly factor 2 [Nitrosomonas europaea]|uniref:FAD assembly factor SdhE n=1 Tax=Nitrosomonas europaea TaxID=915 RepID=UPI002491B60F|nr:succinate dehydrogenase assembly factor 2 [Nitrosomonas europaea]HRN81183.1 succinate dehydrogenase assembly factor 2 [Nitrosomonas europaea]HRO56173.1 succinate dehydrogenase assembly factor 2 [Nitrosomonas europaea]HRQ07708.1 succinate dehydrogenase assembly factor 2 [Nitrosomonas europaea]HUM73238.1 succinate dehydrogenase assembly factor 2 [Nitrosomonas europaea]